MEGIRYSGAITYRMVDFAYRFLVRNKNRLLFGTDYLTLLC